MITNNTVDIKDFVKFTNAGLVTASFTQIRDAITRKYKSIYGEDIDLSTGTADGLFIYDMSLMINNILQGFSQMYSNLSVTTATGVYLDRLCALSNITRKPATYSTASLTITNIGDAEYNQDETTFVDNSGITWSYKQNLTLAAGESTSIQVICDEIGPIEADQGWINKTLEISYLTVSQPYAAIVGQNEETDAELRRRRAQSNLGGGLTVLESLQGALLNISGIRDSYIRNNLDDDADIGDGTSVDAHSVYVALRYDEGVEVEDETIGKILYEKMTPGILTSEVNSSLTTDEKRSYDYIPQMGGVNLDSFPSVVYWKKCKPVHPTITIKVKPLNNFSTDTLMTIGNAVKDFVNGLQINTNLTIDDVLVEASSTDPLFLSKRTFLIPSNGVTITGAVNGVYSNPITYYNYTSVDDNDGELDTNNLYTITISGV